MDFMKLLQVQDAASIIKDSALFPKFIESGGEADKLREELREKDVIIKNNVDHMKELDGHIAELEASNAELKKTLAEEIRRSTEMPPIMKEYESVLSKTLQEREVLTQERDMAQQHLANLEFAFHDLLEKYERAKLVVEGFQSNETVLLGHVEKLEANVKKMAGRYAELKEHTVQKLSEANAQLLSSDKKHISEMAKLKGVILQSQAKINDLEKTANKSDRGDKQHIANFMFEPLKSNFIK